MDIKKIFNKIINQFEPTFDLSVPYTLDNKEYLGYAYFYNNSSRYILLKEAKIWEADAYEHIIFMEDTEGIEFSFEHAKYLITEHMEKNFVRSGNKYPKSNHMYSFLTVIIFTNNDININFQNKVTNFKFVKNYLFTIRGYSEARLVVINAKDLRIFSNKSAEDLKINFKNLLES